MSEQSKFSRRDVLKLGSAGALGLAGSYFFNNLAPFTSSVKAQTLFELPAVILFLTSLGIINPYRLQKIRKYAYFILIIVSILITPPDFLSDILVIIPLLLLYESSISLSKFVYKRQHMEDNQKTIKSMNNTTR
jgi:Sec-independent protein secretion pathway component TatC